MRPYQCDVLSTLYIYTYIVVQSWVFYYMYYFAGHMFFNRSHYYKWPFSSSFVFFNQYNNTMSESISSCILYRHLKKSGFLSPCLQEMFNYLSLAVELYLLQTLLIGNSFSPICVLLRVWLNYHSNITFPMWNRTRILIVLS